MMLKWRVVTSEILNQAFDDDALIANFETKSDESSYEKNDSFLISLIKRLCGVVLGNDAETHAYHMEDWYPNHTRYIYVSANYCTLELLLGLHSLLTQEFSQYRIQVMVDSDLSVDGSKEIGALTIYSDHIIIEDVVSKRLGLPERQPTSRGVTIR